ncbi:MAG: hypothetical protein ACYC1P_11740 [Gaiellaceae bacterium]
MPLYPAAYDGVVGVAATGGDGRLQDWSSRGSWVDLAAPAGTVRVTGAPSPGSVLRAAAPRLGAGLGAHLGWFRCAPDAGPHDCIGVSTGPPYRVRSSDRGSVLVARVVTKPFGELWLAASQRLPVS